MRHRQLSLLLLLACLPLCALHAEEEPIYEGETLSYWIQTLKDGDKRARRRAAGVLADLAPEEAAIPALAEAMKDEDKEVRTYAAFGLGAIGSPPAVSALASALQDRAKLTRALAAFALGLVGPDAKPTIPALTQALKDKDEDVREAAAEALRTIRGEE